MWMPATSYWTQPAGEAHITSAKGKINIALVEIDRAPYLVKPVKQKFDNGERPYNIHASNILWREEDTIASAPLWKNSNGEISGRLIRFSNRIKIDETSAKIVVISGSLKSASHANMPLTPGSFIEIKKTGIELFCREQQDCIFYFKSKEPFRLQ